MNDLPEAVGAMLDRIEAVRVVHYAPEVDSAVFGGLLTAVETVPQVCMVLGL